MNAHLDGAQELIVVDNASSDAPRRRRRAGRALAGSSRSRRTSASAPPPTSASPRPTGRGDGAAQPRHRAARRRARPPRRRGRCELGALVGPRVLNADRTVQPRPAGPRSAPGRGCGPWCPAALQPRLGPGADRALPARAPARVSWLTGACIAGPTALAAPARPVRPGAAHVRRGHRPRPARRRRRGRVVVRPAACRDRPPRPGLVDAGLRLARGLAADRDAQLARRGAPRLRPAARDARAGGRCASTCACGCSRRRCSGARPTATAPRSRRWSRRGPCPSCRRAVPSSRATRSARCHLRGPPLRPSAASSPGSGPTSPLQVLSYPDVCGPVPSARSSSPPTSSGSARGCLVPSSTARDRLRGPAHVPTCRRSSSRDTWIVLAVGRVRRRRSLAGAGYLGPETGRISKLAAERGVDDPDVQARIRRVAPRLPSRARHPS